MIHTKEIQRDNRLNKKRILQVDKEQETSKPRSIHVEKLKSLDDVCSFMASTEKQQKRRIITS